MKHSVLFKNRENKWDNALPLGNGIFGAMLFYEKNKLFMPMNHYEVYYNRRKNVLIDDIVKNTPISKNPGEKHQIQLERANKNQPNEGEPHCFYNMNKDEAFDITKNYAIDPLSSSYPPTGDITFSFDESLKDAESFLGLYVEDAKVSFSLEKDENKLSIDSIIARKDCIINKIEQTGDLLKTVRISLEPYRSITYPNVEFRQVDNKTFVYTITRYMSDDPNCPFVFSGVIRFVGAEGKLVSDATGADITVINAEKSFTILTSVFTEFKYKDTLGEGIEIINGYEASLDELYKEHKEYWTDFFQRGNVSLPDKFLEHIYYVNQYALDCSSGKDGVMKHHACGLNGLWAIRHPNLWGSMWYWDVNIQAAFAGVFSSNRLDLGKVFSDGLLSYTQLGELFAKNNHNLNGYASDYPHCTYYCMGAWCAQYLWFQYEYSLDKEYLKNEAYPFFLKTAEFLTGIFEYDEKKDRYFVYPDISPEQGPLAHNTVITVSCAKFLFKFTLEAAKILGDKSPLLDKCREVMNKLPEYPLSKDGTYGVHMLDSDDAPDNLWIRHPSMLMPLFPIGEFDLSSDPEMLKVFSNSIDYLEDRGELSVFTGSWLAAASARLGRGQTAYRLLYERGIDHMLRSNALTAEETDHFINYCLQTRQPLYYPCMMEFTGQMLAAVNEMVLQSQNGIIRIFPAMPDGNRELGRMLRHGYHISEYVDRYVDYDAWKDVRFDRLLARGAFEVSASLKDGALDWVMITSKKGGSVKLTSPYMRDDLKVFCGENEVAFILENGVITFDTVEGQSYVIASCPCAYKPVDENEGYNDEVLTRLSYTKHKLFIGEDPQTPYFKALDNFTRSWYLGNVRVDNHTVYKFDFGANPKKNYSSCFLRQAQATEQRIIRGTAFVFVGSLPFTAKQGYGFDKPEAITVVDRGAPDELRRDFLEGTEDVEFIIEVPRGQYELLVVSGDEEEDSVTIVEAVNGRRSGGELVPKGTYQSKLLPLVNESDEPVRLKISTVPGHNWKLNYVFMNAIKGY